MCSMCLLCVLRRVWHAAAPWTVAHKVPLSMGFSRQEYWSGRPFPAPGCLPDPGVESTSLESQVVSAGGFFTTSATWEALQRTVTSGAPTSFWANCKVNLEKSHEQGNAILSLQRRQEQHRATNELAWGTELVRVRMLTKVSLTTESLHLTLGSTTSLASQVPKLFYLLNVFFLPLTLERKLKGSSCCWTDEKRRTREIGGSPQDQGLLFPLSWPLVSRPHPKRGCVLQEPGTPWKVPMPGFEKYGCLHQHSASLGIQCLGISEAL